ncbi:MAG: hypothetical protein RDU25_06020 [Patescibacteria group bacterium]|nr:hypothetical protein [Patescibacteria group bacterium]
MMFVLALAIVSLVAISGILYAFHAGQGARLAAGWQMFATAGQFLSSAVSRFWYGDVIPFFQRLRLAVIAVLALGGLVSFFFVGQQLVMSASARTGLIPATEVSWWAAIIIVLVASLGAFAVWFFARPQPEQTGKVTIPAGATQVVVPFNMIGQPPVIAVQPYDVAQDFTVLDVTDQDFTLEIPAALPAPATFNWMVRERPDHSPVVNVGLTTVGALLALGATYFVVGMTFESRLFVLASVPFVVMALAIVFRAWQLAVKLAAWTADAVEAGPNGVINLSKLGIRLIAALFTRNWSKVEEIFKPTDSTTQAVSYVNQEAWEKNRQRAVYETVATLVFVYSLCLLVPTWSWFLAAVVIQTLTSAARYVMKWAYNTETFFYQENKNRVRLFIASTKERSLYLYYALVAALALMTSIVTLVPGADERFQALREAFALLLNNSTDAMTGSILTGMAYLVGIVLTSIVLYVLWPRRSGEQVVHDENGTAITFPASEPAFPRMRKLIAAPFALILLACVAGFVWVLVQGSVVEASASVLSKFIPIASATATPGVRLHWPSVPGANGYVIERRELHEPAYSTLNENGSVEGVWTPGTPSAPRVFVKGTTEYEDKANVVRGSKYFYRIIALGAGAGGRDVVSTETSVLIPAVAAPVPAPTPKPPTTGGSKPATTCSGSCLGKGNPGLTAFCQRHPEDCR